MEPQINSLYDSGHKFSLDYGSSTIESPLFNETPSMNIDINFPRDLQQLTSALIIARMLNYRICML